MARVVGVKVGRHVAPMLTGDQISAARKLAGLARQEDLAELTGLGIATIQRAESAGREIPGMNTTKMAVIVRALESKGVVFTVSADGWTLHFFDDAGDLDFVSSARTLDGREGNIDQWWDEIGKEPLDLLTDEQRKALQEMFLPRQEPMAW